MNLPFVGSVAVVLILAVVTLGAIEPPEVRSVDESPTMNAAATAVPSALTINLEPGWNLVSFSVLPRKSSAAALFEQIAGTLVEVNSIYDGVTVSYVPERQINSLAQIRPDRGYWIFVRQSAVLIIYGDEIDRHLAIQMDSGWNLVTYLVDHPLPVTDALNSIDGKYDEVRGFSIEAKSFLPDLPSDFNNFQEMEPGEAYLIHMTVAGQLIYP